MHATEIALCLFYSTEDDEEEEDPQEDGQLRVPKAVGGEELRAALGQRLQRRRHRETPQLNRSPRRLADAEASSDCARAHAQGGRWF